jgi:hypothetical protein
MLAVDAVFGMNIFDYSNEVLGVTVDSNLTLIFFHKLNISSYFYSHFWIRLSFRNVVSSILHKLT